MCVVTLWRHNLFNILMFLSCGTYCFSWLFLLQIDMFWSLRWPMWSALRWSPLRKLWVCAHVLNSLVCLYFLLLQLLKMLFLFMSHVSNMILTFDIDGPCAVLFVYIFSELEFIRLDWNHLNRLTCYFLKLFLTKSMSFWVKLQNFVICNLPLIEYVMQTTIGLRFCSIYQVLNFETSIPKICNPFVIEL